MQKKAGFTIKQAEAFRNRGCDLGMDDFEKCAQASSALISALAGAGIGGGLGLVSDAIRPSDEDENRTRRRLAALLSGIVLGGAAGAGIDQFKKNTPVLFPPKKSGPEKVFDALDPAPSTAIAGAGIGYWARPHLTNGGTVREWFNPDRRYFLGQPINLKGDANLEIASALAGYEEAASRGKWRSRANWLGRKATGDRLKLFEGTARARDVRMKDLADELLKAMKGNEASSKILDTIGKSDKGFVGDAGRVAKALSHMHAKTNWLRSSKIGRSGRAAALAAGLLALGYRFSK